jgi:hypothetical protein
MKTLKLTGKTFERLTVIRRDGYKPNGATRTSTWLCQCECGNVLRVRGHDLVSGNTRSCGCLKIGTSTHGKSNHPLYQTWFDIKKRCGMVSCKAPRTIKFYHKNNISMALEWLDFEVFYEWAIKTWRNGLVIDRIDTLSGYSPSNCRFITQKANTQNTKRSKWWVVYGKVFGSSQDAANFFGCAQSHIYFLCHGRKTKSKYYYPEPFCYTVKKYGETNARNY